MDTQKPYKYTMFKYFNRKFKCSSSCPPSYVRDVFLGFSGGDYMNAEQFLQFLIHFQGEESSSLSDAQKIVTQILHRRHSVTGHLRHSLDLDDFHDFIFSNDNSPIASQVHHDMTAPLPHYFIYTGHNSYLTGNQLSSDCSDVPIIKALNRGLRVVELDLWPNPTKDDVQVFHGRTLTSPVSLNKCLNSIKEHAFVSSPYPVVITFEDHLTADLQAKVALMVIETFGDKLLLLESDSLENFPSPEQLKYRIIISTKPPKAHHKSKDSKNRLDSSSREKDPNEDVLQRDVSKKRWNSSSKGKDPNEKVLQREVSKNKRIPFLKEKDLGEKILERDVMDMTAAEPDDTSESSDDVDESDDGDLEPGILEYKRLIAIHAGKPKSGLKVALQTVSSTAKRLSLSEQGLEKAVASHADDVVRFTCSNFLRIYPKGTRVTSSNYNPIFGWTHGAQMVALNMQGYGKSLWLMHGMFRSNGGCGYVKKPDFLLANDVVFNPKVTLPVKKTLKVTVCMGDGWRLDFSPTHFDTYSPPDFYTKVYIVGVPQDCCKKKTKVIEDEWVPMWDEEFTFPLSVPELALLRIEVREYDRSEKDDFGGQTCLPVSELKQGFRAVPLFNKRGDKMPNVKLLLKFEVVS